MKKQPLNKSNFSGGEVLTREQLKNILGGKLPTTPEVDRDQLCTCDGGTDIITILPMSATLAENWAKANCQNTYECNIIPLPVV